MLINETANKWSQILTEELGIKDKSKLQWMSQLASVHEIKEGLQTGAVDGGIYSTPLNTMGMGNPMLPMGTGYTQGAGIGNTGADFHNPAYQVGSGDSLPMSTISMALQVAATTIGFELVPVVVSQGPWAMLSYMDFPYAGGKLGRLNETSFDGKGAGDANKPIYIKVSASNAVLKDIKDNFALNADIELENATPAVADPATAKVSKGTLTGKYVGSSRIDNNFIIKIEEVKVGGEDASIAEFFTVVEGDAITAAAGSTTYTLAGIVRPELVSTMHDHVPGFSNFFDGSDDTMTRAQNETGVGNTIGARMHTKMVQMGSFEVTGSVTRQQLQDMPLYGIDVIGKLLETMQNEISQSINKRILDRVFRLGVTNAVNQISAQGVNLNTYINHDATAGNKTVAGIVGAGKYVGIDGVDYGSTAAVDAIAVMAGENFMTAQRRISSKVLAAANVINQVGRRGRANWIVANTQIVTALQDAANFVIAPMDNTMTQSGEQSLYFAGSVAGLNVYCDPYMAWDDTRVCVGRKGDGNSPGVVFMPYILADTVQTIVEGTMAPKLLTNSRFAIVDAGWYPEAMYYCFVIGSDGALV